MNRASSMCRRVPALAVALLLSLAVPAGAADTDGTTTASNTIAMIGAGNMGRALGRLWAAAEYHIIFAMRHPDELGDVLREASHGAEATTIGNAIARADIVCLAVPYRAEPSIAREHGAAMKGKVLVDVDNAIARRDGAIAHEAEAVGEAIYSARLFAGTHFIRAFNLKSVFSFSDPDEVQADSFDMPWTTNDESVRRGAHSRDRRHAGVRGRTG